MDTLAMWLLDFITPVIIAASVVSFGLSVVITFVVATLDAIRKFF